MNATRWFEAFLQSPWYEKVFWLFGAVVVGGIACIWIWMFIDALRSGLPDRRARGPGRAKSGGGLSDGGSADLMMFGSGADLGSPGGGSDFGNDTGGGSDFSGGGGESGGGGASGGWD